MCVIDTSPTIETRRLTLRAPAIEDAARIGVLAGDYAIAKMTTRMPWPYSQGDADGFVARCQTQDRRRDSTFVIELEDEGSDTRVTLTQDNNSSEEERIHSQKNWGMMLGALKKYLEGS